MRQTTLLPLVPIRGGRSLTLEEGRGAGQWPDSGGGSNDDERRGGGAAEWAREDN